MRNIWEHCARALRCYSMSRLSTSLLHPAVGAVAKPWGSEWKCYDSSVIANRCVAWLCSGAVGYEMAPVCTVRCWNKQCWQLRLLAFRVKSIICNEHDQIVHPRFYLFCCSVTMSLINTQFTDLLGMIVFSKKKMQLKMSIKLYVSKSKTMLLIAIVRIGPRN